MGFNWLPRGLEYSSIALLGVFLGDMNNHIIYLGRVPSLFASICQLILPTVSAARPLCTTDGPILRLLMRDLAATIVLALHDCKRLSHGRFIPARS